MRTIKLFKIKTLKILESFKIERLNQDAFGSLDDFELEKHHLPKTYSQKQK